MLTFKLREVMLHQDLEEVTCKQLRLLLEEEMKMDLKKYRGFLDQQMLRILGQMERPSQIFDYLFLVCGCRKRGILMKEEGEGRKGRGGGGR